MLRNLRLAVEEDSNSNRSYPMAVGLLSWVIDPRGGVAILGQAALPGAGSLIQQTVSLRVGSWGVLLAAKVCFDNSVRLSSGRWKAHSHINGVSLYSSFDSLLLSLCCRLLQGSDLGLVQLL